MKESNVRHLDNLNPEERAYIYQQLSAFVPYFLPDSSMGVEIKEVESEGKVLFAVQLTLTGGETYVQAEGKGKDIYQATDKAKKSLLKYLNEIMQRMGGSAAATDEDFNPSSGVLH